MNPRTQEPKNKRGILPIRSFAVAQGQLRSGQALDLRMTGGFQRCFGSFLRASGMPVFLSNIIPQTDWKVQAEIENVEFIIEKFRRGFLTRKTLKAQGTQEIFLDGINRIFFCCGRYKNFTQIRNVKIFNFFPLPPLCGKNSR